MKDLNNVLRCIPISLKKHKFGPLEKQVMDDMIKTGKATVDEFWKDKLSSD